MGDKPEEDVPFMGNNSEEEDVKPRPQWKGDIGISIARRWREPSQQATLDAMIWIELLSSQRLAL